MKTIKNYRGNVKQSLTELTTNGFTRTGKSSFSCGYANKSEWTGAVIVACKELGIEIEFGNDAPRKGANGEFVKLVNDKRKNRKIWAEIKTAKELDAAKRQFEIEYKNKFIIFIKENKAKFSNIKNSSNSWSEAIAQVLNENGFKDFPIGFNSIKSIIFS